MTVAALEGGFRDAARDAAYAFRALMTAMARPGTLGTLAGAVPPAPLSQAAGTAILTLTDGDTPLYLAGAADTDAVREWIAFHTGAPFVGPSHAMFAVGRWDDLLPLDAYPAGTPEYPDTSTTLIVECDVMEPVGSVLSGPGIKDTIRLSLPDPEMLIRNSRRYPLGLDFCFTWENCIVALPRSTRIV